ERPSRRERTTSSSASFAPCQGAVPLAAPLAGREPPCRGGLLAEVCGLVQRPMGAQCLLLPASYGVNAHFTQLEQTIELAAAEGRLLAAPLDFDELTDPGHHQVQVHLGILVFRVIQVQQLNIVQQADADRRDTVAN